MSHNRAILSVLVATLFWGCSASFVKIINLPAPVIGFFRCAAPTLLTVLILLASRKTLVFPKVGASVWVASLLNATRMGFYFLSFQYTTIGKGVVLGFAWPLFALLLDWLLYSRTVTRDALAAVSLGFLGVLIVYAGNGIHFDAEALGMGAMLLSALIYALTQVLLKKDLQILAPLETVFYQNCIGALIFGLWSIFCYQAPAISASAISIVYAVVSGQIAFFLFYQGLRSLDMATAGALAYLEIIWALILAFFIFGEISSLTTILGGCLIVFSTSLIRLRTTAKN